MQSQMGSYNRLKFLWRDTPKWLLFLPVGIVLLSFFLISVYEVTEQNRLLTDSTQQLHIKVMNDSKYGAFCLLVAAPSHLYVTGSSPDYAPLTIQLFSIQRSERISSTIGTSLGTNEPTHRVTCGVGFTDEVYSASPTITNTAPISYVVTVKNRVIHRGVQANRQVPRTEELLHQFTSALDTAEKSPPLLIAQTMRSGQLFKHHELSVEVTRYGESLPTGRLATQIITESNWSALGNRFIALGAEQIITILLAFVPGYLSFFAYRLHEKKKEREAKKREVIAQIQQLHILRRRASSKFIKEKENVENQLRQAVHQDDGGMQDPEIRVIWDEALEVLLEPSFSRFLKLSQGTRSDITPEQEQEVLEWVILDSDLDSDHLNLVDKIGERNPNLKKHIKSLRTASQFEVWKTLRLPPQSAPRIKYFPGYGGENPFSPLSAEDDRFLFRVPGVDGNRAKESLIIETDWYREWYQRYVLPTTQPSISYVIAEDGLGKTASAFLTEYAIMFRLTGTSSETDVLPLYWSYTPDTGDLSVQLHRFARIFTRSIGSYYGRHPQAYLDSIHRKQKAVAHLFATYFGVGSSLEALLYSHRLRDSKLSEGFLDCIREHTVQFDPTQKFGASLGYEELIRLLSIALPSAYKHLVVLMDVQHVGHLNHQETHNVKSLSEVIARMSTQVHVFTPPTSQNGREFRTSAISFVKWLPDELGQLLQDRLFTLDQKSGGSLDLMCDHKDVNITQLRTRVIEASKGSPRRLLFIGQQFIARIEEHRRKLMQEDIDQILDSLDD